MKKILLLILMLMPLSTRAEIFYSNYYPMEMDSENIYEESGLLKKETFQKYNNYSYKEVLVGYYEKDSEKTNSNIDLNNYIITNEYYDNYNEIESIYTNSFLVSDNIKTNKIGFTNCSTHTGVVINYINLYINEELVFSKEVGENLMYKLPIYFNLDDYYFIRDIKIEISVNDKSKSLLTLVMRFYDEDMKSYSFSTRLKNEKETDHLKINFINEDEYKVIKEKLNSNFLTDNSLYYYHLEKYLYRFYDLEKDYYNVYTKEPLDGYNLDFLDHKNYYNYYQRYYLDVKDEITSLDNVVNDTNAPNLDIKYFENDDHTYTFVFSFLNHKFYKKYNYNNKKDTKKLSVNKKVKTNVSNKVTTEPINITTNKKSVINDATENNKNSLILIKYIFCVSILYAFIVVCKKLLSKRFK